MPTVLVKLSVECDRVLSISSDINSINLNLYHHGKSNSLSHVGFDCNGVIKAKRRRSVKMAAEHAIKVHG